MFGNLRKKLNEAWSGADFWQGDENRGQRQSFAQTRSQVQKPAPAQTISKPRQSVGNKFRDVFDANTEMDKFKRVSVGQPKMYDDQQARQAGFKGVPYLPPEQKKTDSIASQVYDQLNVLDNNRTFKQRTPTDSRSAFNQTRRNVKTGMAGVARSSTGIAQDVSGAYDLVTPGTGTNRFTKQMVQQGADIDKFVKDKGLSTGLYKGVQVPHQIGAFMLPGGAAKAVTKGGSVLKAGSKISKVAPYVSNVVVDSLQNAGNRTSKGEDNSLKTAAIDSGVSLLTQGALTGGGKAVEKFVAKPVQKALRDKNIIRPSVLNDNEVADLVRFRQTMGNNMDKGIYSRGVAAADKAGIDYRNPSQVDDLLAQHTTFNTRKQQRGQRFDEVKDRLKVKPLGETGSVPGDSPIMPLNKLIPESKTKAQPTATPLDMQAQSKLPSQPQNQLEQSSDGLTQTQSETVQQRTPEPKLDNSSEPIIPPNSNKIKVDSRTSKKTIPVFKVEQTGQRVSKTNVKTGTSRNFIENEAGELVEDSKGAYKVFTDDNGAITEVRIGDEVYSAKDIGDLTNIRNYGSTMATQRRNIERAFKDNPETGNRVNNLVVDFQQAQSTKMIGRHTELNNGMKAITENLGISFGVGRRRAKKVSAAIQDFGEGKRSKQSLIDEYGAKYTEKIINADKWFRSQYDTLLDEMNATLTKYGYDPVPKRENYYTHFQDETLFKKFGLKMQEINDAVGGPMQEANPTGVRGGIPNELAGQSEYLTPNKRFNQFSLRRKGDERTADAFQAFEKYISPTLNNIYMTPAITRARVISKAIAMENDRLGKDVNQVVVQLREWANSLAGKSNRIGDRQAADTTGARQLLQASNWIQGKVGRNSIVGNVATAAIQPIVLAQTAGKAGFKNTALALLQEVSTAHGKNAPIRQSQFLKRRYSDISPITRGKVQRGADVASTPLRVIEETAGRVTWQSFYNDAVSKGIKEQDAIKYADINAEKTMAGRSIGEKPELYRSKSAGFATQFQLEVNNYIQQVGKEMTPAQVAKTFVAAYGINLLIQQGLGRSVGFNPIEAATDSLEILNDDNDDEKVKKIAQRWAGEVVGNVPVVSSVLDTMMSDDQVKKVFGTQTPVGRFGVGSPYSSFYDNTVGKVVDGRPLEAGAYLAAPFGYSQAQKTFKGVKAVIDGEMTDKDGKTTVEVPQTYGNLTRGALFGPSGIKEVNQYYSNIGVKKEDQKPVQNQSSSKASKMGTASIQTKGNLSKLTKEEALEAQKREYGGKYANLTQDEVKDLAKTDSEAKQYLTSQEATKKAFSDDPELPSSLNSSAKKLFVTENKLTENGKAKWNKQENKDTYIKDDLTKRLPNNVEMPTITNEIAKEWADLKKKKADGTLGKLEEESEYKSVLRKAFNANLSEDEKDLYSLSKEKLQDAYDRGVINDESISKALEVEKKLFEAGLIDKESLARKLGLGARGYKSSGGRGGKGKKGKTFDYKLYGFGKPTSSYSGELQSILEKYIKD
jgi:hypothetical protein